MKIKELFKYFPPSFYMNYENIEIKNLHYDSRKIEPEDLFVALQGAKIDGHQFIDEVLKKGAYVVAEEGVYPKKEGVFLYSNTRKALALLAKAFFRDPDKDLFIAGITGTNGKTTTTYMIQSILNAKGIRTGVIGTIQYIIGDEIIKANNTTPESYEIYKMFDEMRKKGCKAVSIEVSSHAIAMNRVNGIDFDVAIFSNLTQDHLDYHKTMEEYFKTKLRFFNLLQESSKKKKLALLNKDIPEFETLKAYVEKLSLPYETYGIHNVSDWVGLSKKMNILHNIFEIQGKNEIFAIDCPMLGKFNIYNALTAAASAYFFGADQKSIILGLNKVNVNGRFEKVENNMGFSVIIDYAHTPDALENVIKAGRALNPKKLITVFGAGGDRDKTKRPKMGAITSSLSDFIIITSDNPRSENPATIMEEIEKGIKVGHNYKLIENRELAIKEAINIANKGDLVIIAGKGHEDYQIFKDQTIHFSDREVAEKYLR